LGFGIRIVTENFQTKEKYDSLRQRILYNCEQAYGSFGERPGHLCSYQIEAWGFVKAVYLNCKFYVVGREIFNWERRRRRDIKKTIY